MIHPSFFPPPLTHTCASSLFPLCKLRIPACVCVRLCCSQCCQTTRGFPLHICIAQGVALAEHYASATEGPQHNQEKKRGQVQVAHASLSLNYPFTAASEGHSRGSRWTRLMMDAPHDGRASCHRSPGWTVRGVEQHVRRGLCFTIKHIPQRHGPDGGVVVPMPLLVG